MESNKTPQDKSTEEQGQMPAPGPGESPRVKGQNKTERRVFLRSAAASLCGFSLALKEATTEVKEEAGSGEDSFTAKARRVFSVLNKEEIESIQEAAEDPDRFLLSPKLKGNAGLALMLAFSLFSESQYKAAAGKAVSA